MQYLPGLAESGINVEIQSLFDDDYLRVLYTKKARKPLKVLGRYFVRFWRLLTLRRVDIVWLEYELFPYLPAWFEKWLVIRGIALVVDYDDAVFHNYDLAKQPLIRTFLRHKIDHVMRLSAAVVAGNQYLHDRAISAGAGRVELVPTVIDLNRYEIAAPQKPHAAVTVGWIGSPATQNYLKDIAATLSDVLRQYNARLMLIGANADILPFFPDTDVQLCAWSEGSEVQDICSFDIGIMPLPDGPWEQGKCGYKLVQYMACRVPFIASAVGANIEIVRNSGGGLLADSLAGWQDALQRLLSDAELRLTAGHAGRLAVEQQYSLQAQLPKLIDIFYSIKRTPLA
jgi:glycosyltransferase involved in cell wall biosynthesis